MACTLALGMAPSAAAAETLTVGAEVVGSTPDHLGYNLGHFLESSNAADWFRHSGVDSARIFMNVSDLEPADDVPPAGDGVDSESSFLARRAMLRANVADPNTALSPAFVNWNSFTTNLAKLSTGNNVLRPSHVLATLRDAGVDVLVNLSASPGRFPVTGANDWAGRWELWQHYYAVSHVLARDYGVGRFSMFNEPNGSSLTEEQWHERLRICSDAIQAGIADMNLRHGRSLVPRVFAPTTANGADKYDVPGSNIWGAIAVRNRHLRIDGTSDPSWMNLHVYSYQKYTTRQFAESGYSGFLTDYDGLRGLIETDMPGEPRLPLALTEMNVRTGAAYDTLTATQDSPADFSALGANLAGLAGRGIAQIYLFKFAQTASNSFYGIAKNGTHYCQNTSGSPRQYGGATGAAEVYRLFVKAAGSSRPIHRVTASSGASPGLNSGLWSMATQDVPGGFCHLFLSNLDDTAKALELDFAALSTGPENPFFIEEVSHHRRGGMVQRGTLYAGKTGVLDMPARSVWLITLPVAASTVIGSDALADLQLAEHSPSGGGSDLIEVRADGTVEGRKVALIRIPIPELSAHENGRILLEMDVASSVASTGAVAHVYGIEANIWSEDTFNWQQASAFLKSGVPAGNRIEHNVVTGHGVTARILGQLATDSAEMHRMGIDVTWFAKSRTDGMATFLIVQEHRWDVAQPSLESGDTQPAGLRIRSRENKGGVPPRLVTIMPPAIPVIESHPNAATLPVGAPLVLEVEASGPAPLGHQWRKNGVDLEGESGNRLEIPAVGTADSGDYDVVVSNIFGATASQAAGVLVYQPGTASVFRESTIRGGSFADADVDEAAAGYLLVKYSNDLSFSRKSYFQFRFPAELADPDAPASLTLRFQNSFSHQVRLWSLAGFDDTLDPAMTWNNAPANSTKDNDMWSIGVPSAARWLDSVRIAPGSGLAPHVLEIPRLGDVLYGGQVTLVLTGVDDTRNNVSGLRIAPDSVTLDYQPKPPSSWRLWRLACFGNGTDSPGVVGTAADPDRDGIANLLEYALGGHPSLADSAVLPTIRAAGQDIVIRFARNAAAADLELACQRAASAGGPWHDIAVSTSGGAMQALMAEAGLTETEAIPQFSEVTIRVNRRGQAEFFRLRSKLIDG